VLAAKFVRSGITGGSRDIKLENFSLHAGKETLVANASVTLAFGRRYGLVGRNGIGVSESQCARTRET
jgi:ATP-binding cassette subfamily F protein 3